MRCSDCGREHENVKGKCPFCSTRATILKSQKERPFNMSGGSYVIECRGCGQEIREWKTG
jgi:C4-type Zn-finger protein